MTKVVLTIARATLLEALRSRMLWLVGVLLLVAVASAAFLQQVALIETARIQAAIIAALLRACAGFLVAAFVVMSMVREFNDKVLELMLAQPWPRAAYLFGKFVGFSAAGFALAAIVSLPLAFLSPPAQVAIWALSLACELVILAAMSLFCVITLAHVVPALAAVLGFYVLGRSMAAIQIIARPGDTSPHLADRLANWIVEAIAAVLPRFDLMTQTAWLVNGPPGAGTIASVLAQAAIYAALLVAAAQFDLHRQNL
jgi:ABC-type transport system involved in multi-copper enzyme maturation permease subunit